jgi:hypothetical protein
MAFFWKDEHGARQEDIGLTRDVSVSGAYIFAKHSPPLHSTIRLKAPLPSWQIGGRPLLIAGGGRVVRVELVSGEYSAGFAVALKRLVIRRVEEQPRLT